MFLDMIWLELIFQEESNVFYCIEKFENLLILGLEDGLQQFIVCFTDSLTTLTLFIAYETGSQGAGYCLR